jgi:diketogulonate reductase-like aldo/keto reductase
MDAQRIHAERRRVLNAALALGLAAGLRTASAARPPMTAGLTRPIPSTGEPICSVGLGTWQVFDIAGDRAARAQAREALELFAKLGGRIIDSSPMYGSSESVVGELCEEAHLLGRFFIATKVWTRGRDEGIRQMRESMRRLRVSGPLDLMQVHNLLDAQTHLATLRAWKSEGLLRYIGITHYHAGAHAELESTLRKGGIDFVQLNYSLAEPQAETRLLAAAQAAGAAVLVNRPFAEGQMFASVRSRALPGWAAELGCTSWAQMFLKWILSHPAVTAAIPGTRDPRHVADNMAALAGPLPDARQRRRIREAFEGK